MSAPGGIGFDTDSGADLLAEFDTPAAAGDKLMVAILTERGFGPGGTIGATFPAGWTRLESVWTTSAANSGGSELWYNLDETAEVADVEVDLASGEARRLMIGWWPGVYTLHDHVSHVEGDAGTVSDAELGGLDAPDESLLVGAFVWKRSTGNPIGTYGDGFTELDEGNTGGDLRPRTSWAYRTADGPGPHQVSISWDATVPAGGWGAILAAFVLDEDEPEPEEPDPSVPEYTPPAPARAIVEIEVDDPDGPRWDVAEWDVDAWAARAWVDISYLVTRVSVTRGTDRGDLGILARPAASVWQVDTYDPDRELDPNNASSPYYGQVVTGLPIRLNHRSTTLRTARVRTATWSFVLRGGRLTASDGIADMAAAQLPATSDLADTLFERARDALEAADVPIRVLPDPPEGDPTVSDYTPAGANVWAVILDAAQEVLWVPYMTRHNELGFRRWSANLERGTVIASPELTDLASWVHDDGLYSAVRVLDAGSATVVTLAATPTPAYGRRVYDDRVDKPTIDGEAWAAAVLADRRSHGLRFRPGLIRPLNADSVEVLGTIELLEGVDLEVDEASPPVAVHARVLGDRVEVVDMSPSPDDVRSRWTFLLSTSASPPVPLTEDGGAPDAYLTTEDGSDYLYAG